MASPDSSPAASGANQRPFFTTSTAAVWAIAVANLLFHIYFNNRYGYFRDEFDYMSCGDHLAWGYVDQPPLIPFLIHICRAVLGDSLRSIRFIPALASSLLIVQTAVIARELGGRAFTVCLFHDDGFEKPWDTPITIADGYSRRGLVMPRIMPRNNAKVQKCPFRAMNHSRHVCNRWRGSPFIDLLQSAT